MKSSYLSLLAVVVFFFTGISTKAVPDSCLKMVTPHDRWNGMNRDSVMADSCHNSPTYGKWYSKKGYFFGTENYPFNPKPISESDRKTWRDIDSQFATTRDGFELLEQKFGEFTIRRYEDGGDDSMHLEAPTFIIDFKNYQLVDSVIYYVEKIDSVMGCNLNNYPFDLFVQYNSNCENFEFNIIRNNITVIFTESYLVKKNTTEIIIEIFNILGNKVKNIKLILNKRIEIDMSDFVPGIYFLRIDNEIIKFIKY